MADALNVGARGSGVSRLHRRLIALGLEVPQGEVRGDHFGPGTVAAIEHFQANVGLPVTGVLDAATALGLGAGDVHPAAITGVVTQTDGTPVPAAEVELVQAGLREVWPIATTRSAADGSFSIPWPDRVQGQLAVRAEGAAFRAVPANAAADTVWLRLTIGGEYQGPTRFAILSEA